MWLFIRNRCRFLLCSLVLLCEPAAAQRFDLSAPNIDETSIATVSSRQIGVQSQGGSLTVYERDNRFYSRDGQWIGYYSSELRRVLRWPSSNSGSMQLGRLKGRTVEYRTSQMRISRRDGGDGGISINANRYFEELYAGEKVESSWSRLAVRNRAGEAQLLSRSPTSAIVPSSVSAGMAADWWLSPVGQNLVRIQSYEDGSLMALGANRRKRLSLGKLAQDAAQIWRLVDAVGSPGRFVLENVLFPGQCLTMTGSGAHLQQISFTSTQLWYPLAPVRPVGLPPFFRSIHQEVQANPPLPPAKIELLNTHRFALVLLIGDQTQRGSIDRLRIEPGESVIVELQRDAGSTLIETSEVRGLRGGWNRSETVTAIPPASLYDISVYEEHLQSIAIDSTGKSPNPIEDVNYVPKSVGWLPVPPGEQLPDSGQIDLYPVAKAAKNPGAVRRMDPREYDEKPAANPVESLLEEFQSAPRRKF